MESQDQLELIDNYLSGSLSPAEKEAFEASLKTNEMLRQETETQARLIGIVASYGAARLKKRLQKIEREAIPSNSKAKNPYWWLYLLIGLILAGLAWWLSRDENNSSKEPQALYAAFYEPFSPTGLSTRENNTGNLTFLVINAYQQKNYTTLIELLDGNPNLSEENIQFRLMKGTAYLETGSVENARNSFMLAAGSNDPYFTDDARWYQAMTEIHTGGLENALPLIRQVAADENSEYRDKAKKLLEMLAE